ncbi:unnamed protein product [Malus baccata var. baccata]
MLKLESLNMLQNKLSWKFPPQLAKLTFLSFLNLSNNQLVSMIPPVLRNKGLWGPPLTVNNKARLSSPPTLNEPLPNYGHEIDWDQISVKIGFTFGLGVAIGTNGHVVGLDISSQSISGGIDNWNSLFDLQQLQSLNLADNFSWDGNNISAPFPGFYANFSKLTSLSLFDCSLQGIFPKEIFQVPKEIFQNDLSGNEELFGSLPEFPNNGSLRSLHLERIEPFNYNFTGSLPKSMENLTQLVYLDMFSNLFNGEISSIQWENLINLAELHLADNLLEGSILPSLYSLSFEFSDASSNLVTLDLSFNNLDGPIPPFNGPRHLKNLTFIDLSYNSLPILYNGTNSSYTLFPQIAALNLASNKLREVPGFLRNQSHLLDLDLSENHIQGEIPHWIWSFTVLSLNLSCYSLETIEAPFREIPYTFPFAHYLDYSNNHFCYSIPVDIGDFFNPDTSFLSLSNNNLRGIIPASICNGGLRVIDLSNNSLSGMVPRCLRNNLTGTTSNFEFSEPCELHTLDLEENHIKEFLNLGNNQIKVAFPCFLKKISTLHVLLLRSNKFYGSIACPKTNGTWPMLQIIDLAHNNLSG